MTGGGGTNGGTPPVTKTGEEIFFDVIDALCNRFMGLSPFEVLNRPTREVFDLYINCIIHDRREKNGNKEQGDVWVTSANATWH